jgi:hypothetical protein
MPRIFTIMADDKTGLGNLARYIIRSCFSQERMVYVPEKNLMTVSPGLFTHLKDRKSRKVFKFLTFRLCCGQPSGYPLGQNTQAAVLLLDT